jgi:ribulose-5-phosphate 4-epimerase/fuculose-1-phosphate aldolase
MSQTASAALIDDLVSANHILVTENVFDGFGHVSVRHDKRPDRFLISRSLAPSMVQAEDIVECDLEGQVIDAQGRKSYLERFIHSAIYKTRPDVMAVIHSHSPAVIPFGVTGARLRPICHMSGFLGSQTPVYDIRDAVGESSDMLIRNQALGESLARTLGANAVALMRGHGSVAVGPSLQQAVFRAIYTESNARLQFQAMQLGEVNFMSEDEAFNSNEVNEQQLDRPWQLWKLKARHAQSLLKGDN